MLGLFAIGSRQAGAATSLVNHKAPGFVRRDLNGRTVNLARLRGKVVLLNFWATWCAPCEAEIPVFSRWQREYAAQGLQVIGISMDDGEGPVKSFVGRLEPGYPIAMGDAKLGERYGGVLGLPLTYLIDRKGVVRAQFQGSADLKSVEKRIKELLKER
ncbi:MAG TPA: TlpA disulfide reductase family protein [Terracidiphilus sp.]|nr:TlpA disulfide reductase family protein [Terracidiphilus sp.]